MIISICSSIYSVYSSVTVTILCDGGINWQWKVKVKCNYFYLFLYLFSLFFSDCHHIVWWRNQLSMATQGKMWLFFICSSIYSVYSLVTVTILCDGGINCRWQLKVKCDYFYLFLYLFSLFFSDCYRIVWWRNQLSMATQGKMWLFLFVPLFIQFIL